ncbi:keratin-associated protein 8-1 [Pipistrellus kuhlii]|uniref:keratin-associated protein 8-1 n=1 Tax=Pipistrellus kuhlii TaxID=59472 RepID=UPI00174F2CE1|nr:keratin-associated protein 8-1 [Pipistrellus kuhlii]
MLCGGFGNFSGAVFPGCYWGSYGYPLGYSVGCGYGSTYSPVGYGCGYGYGGCLNYRRYWPYGLY